MLTISIETSKLEDSFGSMLKQLAGFPQNMADELTAWQVEDMRRRYPNTDLKEDTAETDVWPRSRLVEHDKKKIRTAIKSRRPVVRNATGPSLKGRSNRPILRPELYDKLVKRMSDLMEEGLAWQ
jgi:hypothetical protein